MSYDGKTLWLVTSVDERLQPWKFPPHPSMPKTTLAEDMHNPKIYGTTTRQTIAATMQLGDQLYYWNGPWTARAGSRGLAIVRNGQVIDTFRFVVA
jgi:hypothetical protein